MRVYAESHHDIPAELDEFAPDLVVISRPGLFVRLQPKLARFGVPLVYWAHDLHYVRVELQRGFDDGVDPRAAHVLRLVEHQCFTTADLVVLPTRDEVERLSGEVPTARAMAINYYSMPVRDIPDAPPSSVQLVFVGGESHAPNRDGIEWFIDAVWPGVRAVAPEARLTVVGRWNRSGPRPGGVSFAGVLPDDELDAVLSTATVGIAPLRFGAGMKRKTLHYLSVGIPVVGTRYAVEGLTHRRPGGAVPGVVIATTADEWVDAITQLDDVSRWKRLSVEGAEFVRDEFSAARFREGIATVVDTAARSRG